MNIVNLAELAIKYAEKALLRQVLEIISKSESLKDAEEKIRALLNRN